MALRQVQNSRSRDRRRIAVGRGPIPDLDEYSPLKAADWLLIQSRVGAKIPQHLREQLSIFTMLYSAARNAPPTKSISEIVDQIDIWCRQTQQLKEKIWISRQGPKNPVKPALSAAQISKEYFSFSQNIMTANYPLAQLSHFLEGAVAVGRLYTNLLQSPHFKDGRTTELWLIWVAVLFSCCESEGIKLNQQNDRGINPGLILLLEKLQKTLPAAESPVTAHGRKSAASSKLKSQKFPIKKGASLIKNANRALALARQNEQSNLLLLFISWLVGLSQIGSGKLSIDALKPTLSQLKELMTTISPSKQPNS